MALIILTPPCGDSVLKLVSSCRCSALTRRSIDRPAELIVFDRSALRGGFSKLESRSWLLNHVTIFKSRAKWFNYTSGPDNNPNPWKWINSQLISQPWLHFYRRYSATNMVGCPFFSLERGSLQLQRLPLLRGTHRLARNTSLKWPWINSDNFNSYNCLTR